MIRRTRFLPPVATALAGALVLLLSACQPLSSSRMSFEPRAVAGYDCGGRTVEARFGPERLALTLDGERHRLSQVRSADGARYETGEGDDHLLFWDKGDHAFLQTGGGEMTRCTRTNLRAAVDALPLTARGNEPGWHVRVTRGHIRLADRYGKRTTRVPRTDAALVDNGYRYTGSDQAHRLRVTADKKRCRDASGRAWPLTVAVQRDGDKTLRGCGGDRSRSLTGAPWVVEDLAGKGIIDASHLTLAFTADGHLSGDASCNRYSTQYSLDGRLRIGAIATTRKACAPALMKQEQRFLRLLGDVRQFRITDNGALRLTTADGQAMTARRGTAK